MQFSTLSANTGSGIRNLLGGANIQNSIVALQVSGQDCMGTITSQGYNIDSDGSCSFTSTGDQSSVSSGSLNLDSTLANNGSKLHPYTLKLNAGSVAIDQIPTGTNGCASTITTDERGAVRAAGTNRGGSLCDVGAYEVSSETPTAVTLKDLSAASQPAQLPGFLVLSIIVLLMVGLGGRCFARRVLKFR